MNLQFAAYAAQGDPVGKGPAGHRQRVQHVRAFADDQAELLPEITALSVADARDHFANMNLEGQRAKIADKILKEIIARLSFLVDVMGMTEVKARYEGVATYHDSCAGLRELGVKEQPRRLLESVSGFHLQEMADCEVCCGFGGTFWLADLRLCLDFASHCQSQLGNNC